MHYQAQQRVDSDERRSASGHSDEQASWRPEPPFRMNNSNHTQTQQDDGASHASYSSHDEQREANFSPDNGRQTFNNDDYDSDPETDDENHHHRRMPQVRASTRPCATKHMPNVPSFSRTMKTTPPTNNSNDSFDQSGSTHSIPTTPRWPISCDHPIVGTSHCLSADDKKDVRRGTKDFSGCKTKIE